MIKFTKAEKDMNTILDLMADEHWQELQTPGTELYKKLCKAYADITGIAVDLLEEYNNLLFAGIVVGIPELVIMEYEQDSFQFRLYRDHFMVIEYKDKSYVYSLVSFLTEDEVNPKFVGDHLSIIYPENLGKLVQVITHLEGKYGSAAVDSFIDELLRQVNNRAVWEKLLLASSLALRK